ncbi:MAG: DNA-processing protein DprA [Candidatus Magasanikbacteria bacterium]|nr:DNA-processing protein DprA [Candidatus Magasanikbacteria bacterium]
MRYHAALAHFPKITPSRYQKLATYFSDLQNLWEAEINDLVSAGLEIGIAQEFLSWRDKNSIEKIVERLEKEHINTVSINEPDYPQLLKEINDPPHTLFFRGNLPDDRKPTLGVVGTRKITSYGKLACQDIVGPLASQGIIIISGLALGIDGVAHQTTLEKNGTTIAVLGTGVNKSNVYPTPHQSLAEKIIENGGAIVSEYPPGFSPTSYSFPARNRIIAGLSLGTLVIEAPETSGALITARCALDYNREVFAVPHAITSPTAAGPNNLIKMGAKLVASAQDILDNLSIQSLGEIINSRQSLPANPTETQILEFLSKEPTHIDVLKKATNLESSALNSALILMEIKGRIRNVGGMNYIRQ